MFTLIKATQSLATRRATKLRILIINYTLFNFTFMKKFTSMLLALITFIGVAKADGLFIEENIKIIENGNYYIYHTDANSVKHYLQIAGNNNVTTVTENPQYFTIEKNASNTTIGGNNAFSTWYKMEMNGLLISNTNSNGTNIETKNWNTWQDMDWAVQVVFEKDGKSAIRLTNANSEDQWHGHFFVNLNEDYTTIAADPSLEEELFIWEFQRVDTKEITYNFYYNEKKFGSETYIGLVGEAYSAPNIPLVGIQAETPEGTILEDTEIRINCTLNTEVVPFEVSTLENDGSFGEGMKWYNITNARDTEEYASYDASQNINIYSTTKATDVGRLYAFTGDPINGYKVYNYLAGADKIMWSEEAGNNAIINMTNIADVTEGSDFLLEKNNDLGYQLRKNGTDYGYVNDVGNKLGYWTAEASATDKGSTINFTLDPEANALIEAYNRVSPAQLTNGAYYFIYTTVDGVDYYLGVDPTIGQTLTTSPVSSWKVTTGATESGFATEGAYYITSNGFTLNGMGTDSDTGLEFTQVVTGKQNEGLYAIRVDNTTDNANYFIPIISQWGSYLDWATEETLCWKIRTGYPFDLTTDTEAPIYYRIKSGRGNYYFTNQDDKVALVAPNGHSANQYWYFVEENNNVKIVSASDGRHISVTNTGNGAGKAAMQNDEGTNTFNTWSINITNGKIGFQTSNRATYLSHNGGFNTGIYMGLWNDNANNDAGTEVSFEETPIHTVNISYANKYSTMYLDYPVTIPSGITVYIANIDNDYVKLTEIKNIIPANTGVVLYSNYGTTANFELTFAEATADVTNNILEGSVTTTEYTDASYSYYFLFNGNNGVGFYKDQFANNKFVNNANKAFFRVATTNPAPNYSFNFDWSGTTGIEAIESEETTTRNGAIYDITGRQVKAMTTPGLYIVDGKKIVVK